MVYFPRETIPLCAVLNWLELLLCHSFLFYSFIIVFCLPASSALVFGWTIGCSNKGFSADDCLMLELCGGSAHYLSLLTWGGCSSMARLSGRCTEPCELCDWLIRGDKLAYGTAGARQPLSRTYGWQLADGMFLPINSRSGFFRPHAPGTVCGGGQLRETRAFGDQPAGRRGG